MDGLMIVLCCLDESIASGGGFTRRDFLDFQDEDYQVIYCISDLQILYNANDDWESPHYTH